jgi:ribose/xylose/arabinose/galactoside ABC-type transport system permease subunit
METIKNKYQNTPIINRINTVLNSLGVWLVVGVIFLLLSISTDTFLSWVNLINVVRQISVNAIVALGASYVVLGGEIDLSTGTLTAFAGCLVALLMVAGINMWVAILIVLVVGLVVGVLSGMIVTYIKIPSFIATLGVSYIYLGATLLLTNSEPISGLPEAFMIFGRGYVADVVPVPVIILFIFFSIGAFVLKYTTFGRSVIAVGENSTAARLSGIDVIKTKILVLGIGGLTAAAAGIVMASRLSSGQPMAGGEIGLTAIAAVFVGGTEKASALNVLAGAIVLGLVNNGLNLLEVNAYWQKVALGIIIVLAVLLDQIRASRAIAVKK